MGNAPLEHELGLTPRASRHVSSNQLERVGGQLIVGERTEHFAQLVVVETAPRHRCLPSMDR
jgi:hypothetical protein